MYEYLKGVVAAITPSFLVLEVQGVGYRLLVTNPYAYQEGAAATVYVQQIIRDNDQALYGFVSAGEKQTFNQLLTVTGIGPKSALAILANASTDGLAGAVAAGDVTYLTKFPGIGKKTAQQIILDLKGKLAAPVGDLFTPVAPVADPALNDALAALVALGYPDKTVAKLTTKLAKSGAKTTDAYLREGLRLLS
ncbi:Holliday junction branch migration protein RuvA [Lacticaseibacillus parakribbianus]|uniref:Holliday junction branch migration protein RuvA n=1 Tax=Lacticaseibacillus parakribbianus TaxID=2970927 RepID=UPI0021CB48BD|nr:Holliday junction branch migration protein RuvA [Lacticaseibacillus parakribbianus]